MINSKMLLVMILLLGQANAKELKSSEIGLLNGTLKKKESVTVRLEFSCKLAEKIIHEWNEESNKENKKPSICQSTLKQELHTTINQVNEEASKENKKTSIYKTVPENTVKQELHIILKPVKEFFGEIKTHASILKPLIEESLIELVTPSRSMESFYFMQFFQDPARDVMDFLEAKVMTKDNLKDFCEELIVFGGDILDSRSDEVKENHTRILRELKIKQHVDGAQHKDQKAVLKQKSLKKKEKDQVSAAAAA